MAKLSLVAGAVLTALYVGFGPAWLTSAALVVAARAMLVATLLLLASMGAGRAVLARLAPTLRFQAGSWAFALAIGTGVLGFALSAFAGAGLFSAWAVGFVLVVGLLGWFGSTVVTWPRPGLPGWCVALLSVLLIPLVIGALSPPTDTDEIYQHLALARRIAEDGVLRGGFDAPEGSRPQWVQATFAAAYTLGGAGAARMWHLGIVFALFLAVAELGAARFGPRAGVAPVLVGASSYSVLHEAGLAYNDLPAALFLLLAAELVLREFVAVGSGNSGGQALPSPAAGSLRTAVVFGLLLGLAVSAKLTAGPASAALGLAFFAGHVRTSGMRALRPVAVAAVLAFTLLVPWLLRNATSGLHPLFPYLGWPGVEGFRFIYAEKYGVGHSWGDAIRLPLDLLLRARVDSFVFLGQLSYGWAALVLGAGLVSIRRPDARVLLAVLGVGFVAWANSAQLLRYLLPLVGIAMLLGAASGWPRLALLLTMLSSPANVLPIVADAGRAAKVVAGLESQDAYLSRELSSWKALAYLRDHVPASDRVALMYAWHDYWIRQPTVLGSVEDHTPVRHWLSVHGDEALAVLYSSGVRWIFVGDGGFLRKTYAFLPEAAYRAQFVEPRERLDRLLLRDAVREFDEGHWAVWRLDAPPVGD